jgi:hypothetical protein
VEVSSLSTCNRLFTDCNEDSPSVSLSAINSLRRSEGRGPVKTTNRPRVGGTAAINEVMYGHTLLAQCASRPTRRPRYAITLTAWSAPQRYPTSARVCHYDQSSQVFTLLRCGMSWRNRRYRHCRSLDCFAPWWRRREHNHCTAPTSGCC